MHFALPPRKTSHPPPYMGRSSRLPSLRRSRLQFIGLCVVGVVCLIIILRRITSASGEVIPSDAPAAVIVTVLDLGYNANYLQGVKDNRAEYAKKHGYATFFANTSSYELNGAPSSWARVPAMRHAMTQWPYSKYFWYLDQNALIMNPELSLEHHLMDAGRLESLMLKEQPIVPPDSVIKTFPHLRGDQVDLVLTQDNEGISQRSFILKRGDWAKFFLDAWFDPLYRTYNFQKADAHALEHIVQWHPTILSRLTLIPQRLMNAYTGGGKASANGEYKDGDFVVVFAGCEEQASQCESQAEPFSRQWRTIFHAQR